MTSRGIFDVDEKGLADILARKGKEWILYELYQNAVDAPGTTAIDFTVVPSDRKGITIITVVDNDPDGFVDLSHAYTLFAPSVKRDDPTKRGLFNLGEKMVLVYCTEAYIRSTKGTVSFDEIGRHSSRRKREHGTEFHGSVRMTKGEREAAMDALHNVIVPAGVTLTINGAEVVHREPIETIRQITLPTVISDPQTGALKPSRRQTTITLYQPPAGADGTPCPGMLYEGGIPVCEVGDRWDADIAQRVPVNMERDNVPAAFLRAVRVAILNAAASRLDKEELAAAWVQDAIQSPDLSTDAITHIVHQTFGPNTFTARPGDVEGKLEMLGRGFVEVPAHAFSKAAREHLRRAGLAPVPPPSAKKRLDDHLDGAEYDPNYAIPKDKWSPGMLALGEYTCYASRMLFGGRDVHVSFVSDVTLPAAAMGGGGRVTFNKVKLGNRWIDHPDPVEVDDLVIHELAHAHTPAGGHLSHAYHETITRAAAVGIALARDGLLESLRTFRARVSGTAPVST